jgi:hypothetical protein
VETDDTGNNPAITGCSYLYECCAAACSWFASDPGYINGGVIDANEDGVISWGEVKAAQLLNGDAFHPGEYDETMFPMIRCFHHHDENRFRVPDPNQPGNYVYQGLTINVAMAGNVYRAPVHWELFGGATQ